MTMTLSTIFPSLPGMEHKETDPYEVLTLHREHDDVCVVRLSGFDNTVFWKEIKLNPRFFFKSPRQKIMDAQIEAQHFAEKLRYKKDIARHEYEASVRL